MSALYSENKRLLAKRAHAGTYCGALYAMLFRAFFTVFFAMFFSVFFGLFIFTRPVAYGRALIAV